MDREDSISEHGVDLYGTGVSRDLEAVRKAAAGVCDGVILLAVQIECAITCDGERASVFGDLHVPLLHLRQLRREHVTSGVFPDGHQRDPMWRLQMLLRPVHAGAAKKTSQALPQIFHLVQLIPP
jgi:hypothetical protein